MKKILVHFQTLNCCSFEILSKTILAKYHQFCAFILPVMGESDVFSNIHTSSGSVRDLRHIDGTKIYTFEKHIALLPVSVIFLVRVIAAIKCKLKVAVEVGWRPKVKLKICSKKRFLLTWLSQLLQMVYASNTHLSN